ncbi:hypothetical protein FIV32_02215 [Sphingomonadales bacterium 58]|uniref:hypothetical protein n=1 Tax=Sphingobium sp. S8 TaxID=2758385 RepID=UPI00191AD3FD|nr:hypothetical protein [Sphingobium sp. S8]MBY2957564.1 hypothetical protein [Sphingomonadales bacterium 58]
MHVIDRDRYIVAHGLNRVRAAIRSYSWLLEGRGPYEWDDDKYRDEFGDAVKHIEAALDPFYRVAWDKSDCTKIEARVIAAKEAASELLKQPLGPREMIETDIMPPVCPKCAAIASPSPQPDMGSGQSTVEFVQDWLMSGDHEPDDWHKRFAAAIDARSALSPPASQSVEKMVFPRERIARLCLSAIFGFEYQGESLCDEAERIFCEPNPRAVRAVQVADEIAAALLSKGEAGSHA